MRFIPLILILLICQVALCQNLYLVAGTYTHSSQSKGIYVYSFNSNTGDARLVSTAFTKDPSFLTMNDNQLFAVNELENGKGGLSSFSFDRKNGTLKPVNNVLVHGDAPCYLSVDASHKWIATANYTSGSLSILPVKADGSVGEAVQVIEHHGSGADKARQEKAHVHSTVFTPDNHFLAVADLGMDQITLYPFDATKEKPVTDKPLQINTAPGSGPRHILFAPNRHLAYLIEELSGNVVAYRYHGGQLDSMQTISSHPADFHGDKGSSAIHFSPDGKFLYTSNRGESNTIAIFSVDASTGRLRSLGFQKTGGDHPRDFTIDPTGNFLLAGNMKSDNVIIFKRNTRTGLLTDTGKKIMIPQPTKLLFTHIK